MQTWIMKQGSCNMDQLQSGNWHLLHEARYMRRETTWHMSRTTWFSYKQVAEMVSRGMSMEAWYNKKKK
jgi:hypothetical protein